MRALILLTALSLGCSSKKARQPADDPSIVPAGSTANRPPEVTPGGPSPGTGYPDEPAPAEPQRPQAPPAKPGDPIYYPAELLFSPITQSVGDRLRSIANSGERDRRVLMKVGDSISYSYWFLSCFAPEQQNQVMDLGDYSGLAATVEYFSAPLIEGATPLDRTSLSTKVGATAEWPITGSPAPIDAEIAATNAGFAVVMYGTNDLNYTGTDSGLRAFVWRRYAQDIFAIVDRLIDSGVVPLLSTIPHNEDHPSKAPVANVIVRGVAQALQVPLVDFYKATRDLPRRGLGSDGIHPSVYVSTGVPRACFLTADGLTYGYNMRNLVTLESIERMRQVVALGSAALDDNGTRAAGAGSVGNPVVIHELPFTDWRAGVATALSSYSCGGVQSGPETVYRVELLERTAVRAMVFRRGGFEACRAKDLDCTGVDDVSVTLFSGAPGDGECLASNNTWLGATLDPGTYFLSVDSKAESSEPSLFAIMACEPGDAQCL